MKNPWKTISSEAQYDNPWISVTEHQVVNPGGGDGIYGVVNFKNIATGVVVLDGDLNTWLVGQHRYPLDEYSWEIPEGGGALDADPLETIQRELLEETGISAQRWDHLMRVHLSNCITDEVAHLFLARELSFGDSSPDEDEALVVRSLPFSEAYELVLRGEITDGVSVMAIQRVQAMIVAGELS